VADPTKTQLLSAVREAILEILQTGQAVTKEGRVLTMADLQTLRNLEKDYEAEVAAESATKSGRNRLIYVTPE
jgi:hypothetical protein